MIATPYLQITGMRPGSLSRLARGSSSIAARNSSHSTLGRLWQSSGSLDFPALVPRQNLPSRSPCRRTITMSAPEKTIRDHYLASPPISQNNAPIPSEESSLRDAYLSGMPAEHKWGWVIYRCTYTDDSAWARFRARVEKESRESLAESDVPEIAERMEWVWVDDDRNALDGASTAALRERFRAWREEEIARQPGDYDFEVIPRWRYFIKIDQEVMDSLVESLPDDTRWLEHAFVKFVDEFWDMPDDKYPRSAIDKDDDGGEQKYDLEPIEGCTKEDVGFMRIMPDMINASFYSALCGDENFWGVFYQRPPWIVKY
ncbi:hypothetical protein DM02DRAFT_614458 [Periconia macrospinosa]|uniref:Uncharacterized protein n=1 Tax=Periconia macrospinosa TaxID=97972 RepID=A0A2V1DSP4_9PLEO|nr:hypothetical protein DM02DRAFT_614458 [Periconia macrospinosa]